MPNALIKVFYKLSSNQNKIVSIIELPNENEQNVISYGQLLRKLKIHTNNHKLSTRSGKSRLRAKFGT